MIEKVKSRKLNMPMLEIVITLGILTVVSVFVLRLFLGANSLENKAKDISKACIMVQSTGETIKAAISIEEAVDTLGAIESGTSGDARIYKKYYNSGWKETREPSAYTMTLTIAETSLETGSMITADIEITKEKSYAVIKEDTSPLAFITCKSYKEGKLATDKAQ